MVSKFNKVSDKLFKPVLILSIFLFLFGLLFSFYLSPDDYQQGSSVRIMYVHVPSAWLALLTYAIMTLYSIMALAFRIPFGFIFNTAVAPIGAVFVSAVITALEKASNIEHSLKIYFLSLFRMKMHKIEMCLILMLIKKVLAILSVAEFNVHSSYFHFLFLKRQKKNFLRNTLLK